MSYKYEVKIIGEDKWHSNGVAFETEDEATQAGEAKWMARTMCDEFRIVESDETANYKYENGGVVSV